MADLERECERKLALCKLASLAEGYTLSYCFRKKERGRRWTSIELPEKHRQIAECMRPENGKRFLNEFVVSGKSWCRENSDDDVEDSGWEESKTLDTRSWLARLPASYKTRWNLLIATNAILYKANTEFIAQARRSKSRRKLVTIARWLTKEDAHGLRGKQWAKGQRRERSKDRYC